ncbi:hypothetical protein Hanom_Chr06g00486931 [Helianthus anomalus]
MIKTDHRIIIPTGDNYKMVPKYSYREWATYSCYKVGMRQSLCNPLSQGVGV